MDGQFDKVMVDGRTYVGVLRDISISQSTLTREVFELRSELQEQKVIISRLENGFHDLTQRSISNENRLIALCEHLTQHSSRSEQMMSHIISSLCPTLDVGGHSAMTPHMISPARPSAPILPVAFSTAPTVQNSVSSQSWRFIP